MESNIKALLLAGYDNDVDADVQKNHLSANRLSVDYVEEALNYLNVHNIEKYYMENDNNYMSASELSSLLVQTFKDSTDDD